MFRLREPRAAWRQWRPIMITRKGCKLALIALAMAAGISLSQAQPQGEARMTATLIPGKPVLSLGSFDLSTLHYVVEEYSFSGSAVSYQAVGAQGVEGRWAVKSDQRAPFTTRLVVVRPADAANFNGTVVVEWLNVSAGTDVTPDWSYTHRELIRQGYAYVAVSAQKVGIDGGGMVIAIPGMMPLKKADPVRYAALNHPGDAFSYDIYTQAARAVHNAHDTHILGPLKPKHVLATGESQSAGFLTTYVDAIEPIANAFDGFLIHSRFGSGAPLEGNYMPNASATAVKPVRVDGLQIRDDLKKPVLVFITETDLMFPGGYLSARQPDNDHLRVWEVPGTAHGDLYVLAVSGLDSGSAPIEMLAKAFTPTNNVMGMTLPQPINAAPQHHYIMQAALASLNRWIVSKEAPAHGHRLNVNTSGAPLLVLDENGNATGGIRSPWVDVPTSRLSGLVAGLGRMPRGLSDLLGTTEPFHADVLARLYPGGKTEYLGKFSASLKSAIDAGFILPADEAEIKALAAQSFPTGP
ncbi:MAG TPA: alpha/beta hydrolase domain-containing protein [Steroidobacteraceae bacterium]|nr:alpha/beta hydrolase domain-containing protein [Steroidobacteraceae bacterium]